MATITHIAAGNDRSSMVAGSVKKVRGHFHICDPNDATRITALSRGVAVHSDGTYSVPTALRSGNPLLGNAKAYVIEHDVIRYIAAL